MHEAKNTRDTEHPAPPEPSDSEHIKMLEQKLARTGTATVHIQCTATRGRRSFTTAVAAR